MTRTLLTLALVSTLAACGGPEFQSPGETSTGGNGGAGSGGSSGSDAGSSGAGGESTGGVGGNTDAGTADASTGGQPTEVDCTASGDGTPCEIDAGAGICLTGECVQTRCGDEYTDREAGEFCDDGQNGNDADGCTDDCQASCSKDTDCADQDLCNGEERCVNDVCVNGAAVVCNDSDPCTVDSCVSASGICSFQALDDGDSCGGGSICVGGSCSASRCGDGFVDASRGEECDDGKDGDDTDGCKDDCKFTCKTNADCTPTNRCQASTCNTTTHQCSAPTTITCDDQDACTVDSCNTATGCVFSFIDADHDGFAPNTCKAGGSYATKGGDCDDTNNNVFPGQTAYFTSKTAKGSWDYNCSSVDEKEFGAIYQPTGTVTVCSGWENSAPACGFSGTYVSRLRGSQGQCTCITGSCESTKTQACH